MVIPKLAEKLKAWARQDDFLVIVCLLLGAPFFWLFVTYFPRASGFLLAVFLAGAFIFAIVGWLAAIVACIVVPIRWWRRYQRTVRFSGLMTPRESLELVTYENVDGPAPLRNHQPPRGAAGPLETLGSKHERLGETVVIAPEDADEVRVEGYDPVEAVIMTAPPPVVRTARRSVRRRMTWEDRWEPREDALIEGIVAALQLEPAYCDENGRADVWEALKAQVQFAETEALSLYKAELEFICDQFADTVPHRTVRCYWGAVEGDLLWRGCDGEEADWNRPSFEDKKREMSEHLFHAILELAAEESLRPVRCSLLPFEKCDEEECAE